MTVRRLFRFLEREGVLLHDPTLDLELPSGVCCPAPSSTRTRPPPRGPPGHATPRGKRSRAILELLYGTGIRVSECERLDVSDVDLARGLLFVRDGKGRKDRVVPVLGRAADALDVYLRDARPLLMKDPAERALFLTCSGTRLQAKRIHYLVRRTGRPPVIDSPSPRTPCAMPARRTSSRTAPTCATCRSSSATSVQSTAIYTDVAHATSPG